MEKMLIFTALLLQPQMLIAENLVDDPATSMHLPWTAGLKWSQVLDISTIPGSDVDMKLATAQQQLSAKGGGVVYFPPGLYKFKQSILLKDGIILRGATPAAPGDARKESYQLSSHFEFPKYEFKDSGDGTPLDTAFKAIEVENPSSSSNTGVVNLDINRGHILFKQAEDGSSGKNRLVFGCVLHNTAFADPGIPDAKVGQKPWQRYTWRFGAAIDVKSSENLLVANNRMPKSGDDDFKMNGYVVLDNKKQPFPIDGVPFDYDNRTGIYANHESLGGPGGIGPDGTPETNPLGFRKGVVVSQNYVYSTGRCAIGFSGDGTICSDNVIRFAKDVWRPTATGRDRTGGSSTNDNRAMEIRGWRWKVSNNDYEVYRNWAFDRKYYINDGEGLMHEDHANSTIKESVLTGNRGNSYLSMYKTAGIDGLLIEGNDIRLASNASDLPAIFVCSNRTDDAFPTRNVKIINNTVGGQGIVIDGSTESSNNLIKGNKTTGPCYAKSGEYTITNQANAKVEANEGFAKVDTTPWVGAQERKRQKKEKQPSK
ncbi:MAG: right-handed parallel beta-helix repeat-containing protein [Luteolibacter sp.]